MFISSAVHFLYLSYSLFSSVAVVIIVVVVVVMVAENSHRSTVLYGRWSVFSLFYVGCEIFRLDIECHQQHGGWSIGSEKTTIWWPSTVHSNLSLSPLIQCGVQCVYRILDAIAFPSMHFGLIKANKESSQHKSRIRFSKPSGRSVQSPHEHSMCFLFGLSSVATSWANQQNTHTHNE